MSVYQAVPLSKSHFLKSVAMIVGSAAFALSTSAFAGPESVKALANAPSRSNNATTSATNHSPTTAQANYDESKLGHFPEMLSYNQLLSLSQAQQEQYVKSIQAMLVELSENSVGLSDQMKRQSAMLELLFPEAFAAPGDSSGRRERPEPYVRDPSKPLDPVRRPGGEPAATTTAPAPAPAGDPAPATNPPPAGDPAPTGDPAPGTAAPAAPTEGGCRTEPVQCRKKTREERRKDFESSSPGGKDCIFAGNVSKYENGKRCSPVSELTFTGLTKPLKCVLPNVLCNPLVFGVKGDVDNPEPLCVRSQMEATKECASRSTASGTIQFLQGKDKKGSKLRLAESWNELKKFINSVCGTSEKTAEFHCAECNIIMERLHEANLGNWSGKACDGRTFQVGELPKDRDVSPGRTDQRRPTSHRRRGAR